MARPRKQTLEKWALPVHQERSRETRERLLAAAERVFAEKGYDGAKLSDIAEDAGVSVGAVYFRFKDKDALFQAIAETFAEESRGRLQAFGPEEEAGGLDAIARNFVLRTAHAMAEHRGLFRAIVERGLDHPEIMDTMMSFRDDIARAFEAALRRHCGETREPGDAVRVVTQMVYGFLLVGIINPRAPTGQNRKAAIAGLADAVVAYLKTVLRP